MAKLKVSELQAASNVNVNDTMYLVQNGVSKQVTVATFRANTLGLPQVAKTINYSLAFTDQDKHLYFTNSSNASLYVPNNSEIAFPVGTQITVIANTPSNVGVDITGNTGVSVYQATVQTPGNKSLTSKGVATLYNVAANTWFIAGYGLI
jgi:hypothetical protein